MAALVMESLTVIALWSIMLRVHQVVERLSYGSDQVCVLAISRTKLIEKARNNAPAYEKRSEHREHELTKADLEMATRLDPFRVYPYRYRTGVLMDSRKEKKGSKEVMT